jgi:hypothetical protein
MTLLIINPVEYPYWDELVLATEDYSIFHSAGWAKVLIDSYKYKPLYFACIEKDRLIALLPVIEINSVLTGRRGVSLPFTDQCEPIASDQTKLEEIATRLIKYGKRAGWKRIEWRGENNYVRGRPPYSAYCGHNLKLTQDDKRLFSRLKSSTQRNIKKAIREGVKVELTHSFEAVRTFFRLHCMTRKHHGLPPQPVFFFKNIFKCIIKPGMGFVALASYANTYIAGAIYFHFGDQAIFKFGASDREYQHLRPNNLVIWKAISWYAKNGFENFSFGRTEPQNKGLMQFKRGWGSEEEIINYFRLNLLKNEFEAHIGGIKSSYNFFKRMPSPLLNLAGTLLYRHFG